MLCTTKAFGGMEMNVLRLASWMRLRGHACVIAAVEGGPLLEQADRQGIPTISLRSPWRYGAFRSAATLSRELKRLNIRFLVANATRDLNLAVLAKRCSGNRFRLIYTQHMQLGGPKLDAFHRWEHGQLDAWLSPLPWLARQTSEWTAVHVDRINTIPFGIDLSVFHALPSRSAAREYLRIPESAFVIGTVGRLDPGKGQEFLLHALALLRDHHVDLHALLVGDETRDDPRGYSAKLEKISVEFQLGDRVHFRPFMENIGVAYAAMDCFALTSLAETYGMVTIEAMAAGLTVIGTDSAGTPDIISSGHTGLLVPPGDPTALARAIHDVRSDFELRSRLGSAAREQALTAYSHDAQCSAYEQLCERIA